MTDAQANKAVATQLFERFYAWDIPGVLDLLADDATWWLHCRRR